MQLRCAGGNYLVAEMDAHIVRDGMVDVPNNTPLGLVNRPVSTPLHLVKIPDSKPVVVIHQYINQQAT